MVVWSSLLHPDGKLSLRFSHQSRTCLNNRCKWLQDIRPVYKELEAIIATYQGGDAPAWWKRMKKEFDFNWRTLKRD